MITDPKNFRTWLLQSARAEAERHFNAQQLLCLIPRESAWYAICLLESEEQADRELANRILTNLRVDDGTHSPCTLDLILRRYGDRLSAAARDSLMRNLRENLPISATVRYSDGNVNHPIAAYVHLVLGGERFGLVAYVELGRALLRQFHQTIANRQHRFYRQAEMAEYNSPTYTALTLWFLALAAEYSVDPEIRRRSLALEEQLWIDVALHWHAPTQQFAGPFSRAYAEDSLGGFSGLHCTFAQAFNCGIYLEPDLPRRLNHPSALIQNAMIAAVPFHVPLAARRLAFDKPMPLLLRCTTYGESYHENAREMQSSGLIAGFDAEVYPGGWSELTTFLHPDYTLASASRPYVNAAQSDALVLRVRRKSPVCSMADFHSMTTRMVFDQAEAGEANLCHTAGFSVGSDYLYEEGRTLVYQHENRAIEVITPKRAGQGPIQRLRLDLLWNDAADFAGLYIDGCPAAAAAERFDPPKSLLWIDGSVAIAVMPMFLSSLEGAKAFVQLRHHPPYKICSFFLYEGEKKIVSRDDLSASGLGLGFWVVSLRDKPLQTLLAQLRAAEVQHSSGTGGSERIDWTLDGGYMQFDYNRFTERITRQCWNGADDQECWFSLRALEAHDQELPTCLFSAD